MRKRSGLAIVGTVGLPAKYGGFETLVQNLVVHHHRLGKTWPVIVYCSSRSYRHKQARFLSAQLRYLPIGANGVSSILYDIVSILMAFFRGSRTILLLGVSGAIVLPFLKPFRALNIITNVDGIEWKRKKWRGGARLFLRFSEMIAVHFSDVIIADNDGIANYVSSEYRKKSHVIPYGGDQDLKSMPGTVSEFNLPEVYAFSVCRIEPENNIHLILEAFAQAESIPIVIVGNWASSSYGRSLRNRYEREPRTILLDPIYDSGKLKTLRARARLYVHGHSAGGTNPSLVEAMCVPKPVIAFDCVFNRFTTEGQAYFFSSVAELSEILPKLNEKALEYVGVAMGRIAEARYTWEKVSCQYFSLLESGSVSLLERK